MSKEQKFLLCLVFLGFLLLMVEFNADMTVVPQEPSEMWESQFAIVSWNGDEEVLVLGVNLKMSRGMTGLGVLPLPSLPSINLGSKQSFEKIDNLFPKENSGLFLGETRNQAPSIVFYKSLGIHNVTCVHVPQSGGGIQDVLTTVSGENEIGNLSWDDNSINLLENYASRGYEYFLIDVIDYEGETEGFLQPLIIKFETNKLWFPLRVGRVFNDTIFTRIAVITNRYFTPDFTETWNVRHRILSRWRVGSIDEALLEVFSPFDVWFHTYLYEKSLKPKELTYDFSGERRRITVSVSILPLFLAAFSVLVVAIFLGETSKGNGFTRKLRGLVGITLVVIGLGLTMFNPVFYAIIAEPILVYGASLLPFTFSALLFSVLLVVSWIFGLLIRALSSYMRTSVNIRQVLYTRRLIISMNILTLLGAITTLVYGFYAFFIHG